VSTAGGNRTPRWRRDGREIFYLTPDNMLMTAEVNGRGGAFDVGRVTPLFQANTVPYARNPYDVSADGQRFLINTPKEEASAVPITVVVNWTAGLTR
jgi:hypothetical protein